MTDDRIRLLLTGKKYFKGILAPLSVKGKKFLLELYFELVTVVLVCYYEQIQTTTKRNQGKVFN